MCVTFTYQKLEYKPSDSSIGATTGKLCSTKYFRVDESVKNTSASRNYLNQSISLIILMSLFEYKPYKHKISPYMFGIIESFFFIINYI